MVCNIKNVCGSCQMKMKKVGMGKSFYDKNIEAVPDKTDKFNYKRNVKRKIINLEKIYEFNSQKVI